MQKKALKVLAVIFLLLAGVCVALVVRNTWHQSETSKKGQEDLASGSDSSDSSVEEVVEEPVVEEESSEAEPEPEPYVSPIDFAALQEVNPDIFGWLEIPGMDLSEPLLNRAGDNAYYLTRDSDGANSNAGSLFVEDYNSLDFSDPVTVIYGHNMRSGAMFGFLQERFSDSTFFEANRTFTIYLPEAEYEYTVFAAVPYSDEHLLYYHDFTQFSELESFIEDVYATRSLIANVDTSITIEEGDRIVILSTCLGGDNTQRYLVMGVYKSLETETEETQAENSLN